MGFLDWLFGSKKKRVSVPTLVDGIKPGGKIHRSTWKGQRNHMLESSLWVVIPQILGELGYYCQWDWTGNGWRIKIWSLKGKENMETATRHRLVYSEWHRQLPSRIGWVTKQQEKAARAEKRQTTVVKRKKR